MQNVIAEPAPPEALKGVAAWRDLVAEGRVPLLLLVFFGDWLVAADSLVTATIMPDVGASLSAYAWFGWAASAFLTGVVAAAATAGWLSEKIGIRSAMTVASALFGLACAMSALAPGIALFLAGRTLQGIAAGWLIGLCYVIVATLMPTRHLVRIFALVTSIWGIATVTGPMIGGLFADAGNWRGVFWLFAGQAAAMALLSPLILPRPAGSARVAGALPWATLVPLILGIGAIATASVVAGTTIAVALALLGAILLLQAFRADRASAAGLLPRSTATSPAGPAYLVNFTASAAGAAFMLYAPTMLVGYGASALKAGYIVAAEALVWTAASLLVSGADERRRPVYILTGTILIFAGVCGQALFVGRGSFVLVALAGGTMGAGFGLAYSFLSQRVIVSLAEADRARGSSAIGAVRNIGAAIGAAAAGIAANATGFAADAGSGAPIVTALAVFGSAVPFAGVALLVAYRMRTGSSGH